jgi:hypothetical protein
MIVEVSIEAGARRREKKKGRECENGAAYGKVRKMSKINNISEKKGA